ncbi:MAG: hypothetical protein K8T25_12455 [Planctomycetia bacterium]|nr:hypothetical protein [Planctomycetia bacterium]
MTVTRCFKLLALLLLLVTSATPIAAAEPAFVPHDVASLPNVVTRADLDRLNFSGQVDAKAEPERLKSLAGVSIGLFLQQTTVQQGESIPAWFVLKNDGPMGTPLPLDMRFDWFNPQCPFINSCELNVEGPPDPPELKRSCCKVWACGGPPMCVVPNKGYYCVRGDLAQFSFQSPREFRVCWRYFALRSNEVRVTVTPRTGGLKRPTALPHDGLALLNVEVDPQIMIRGLTPAEIKRGVAQSYKGVRVSRRDPGSFAAALAVGVDDRWYPDLLNLPQEDNLLKAEAKFVTKSGEQVPSELVITLLLSNPKQKVIAPGQVAVKLLITRKPSDKPHQPMQAGVAMEKLRPDQAAGPLLTMPPLTSLQWRYALPPGWNVVAGLEGKVRVAAIVTGQSIVMPDDWLRSRLQKEKTLSPEGYQLWDGVLCTESTELTFPPPPNDRIRSVVTPPEIDKANSP